MQTISESYFEQVLHLDGHFTQDPFSSKYPSRQLHSGGFFFLKADVLHTMQSALDS